MKMPGRGAIPIAWVVACSWPHPASASDPGAVAGIHGATMGAGAAAASERRAGSQNPAAFAPSRRGFLLHAHRPFGLEDLAVVEAGASRDGERWGFGATWRQIGAEELFLGQSLEVQAARRLGPFPGPLPGTLDLGSAFSVTRRVTAGRETAWDYRHGHGATWRPVPALAIGAFARGLAAPFGGGEAASLIRQIGVEARAPRGAGGASQSLRFDLRRTGSGDWRALASLSLSPHPAFEAAAGLSSAPFRFSLGIRIAWGGLAVWQAFRHHGALGPTWLSSRGFAGAPGD
jgi:hypothetical protein